MAIIRLDCNLNGGDSVTPNNELFYRIYGEVDNYGSPIHTTGTALSDVNVIVDNDNVIITGVDGTTNTSFKIAAVDAAFNEGILSDAYKSNTGLEWTGVTGFRTSGPNTNDPSGKACSIEVRAKILGTSGKLASLNLASNASGANFGLSITIATQTLPTQWNVVLGTGSSKQTSVIEEDVIDGNYHIFKATCNADGSFFGSYDGVDGSVVSTGGVLSSAPDIYIGTDGLTSDTTSIIDWCKVTVEGVEEVFELNEGSGSTTTGSLGSVLTLEGDNWVSI